MDFTQLFKNVNPADLVLVYFFCIGTVEVIRRAFKKDWEAVAIILGSAITGGVVALLIPGFTVIMGAAAGLGASGLVTLSQKFTSGTNAEPTSVL